MLFIYFNLWFSECLFTWSIAMKVNLTHIYYYFLFKFYLFSGLETTTEIMKNALPTTISKKLTYPIIDIIDKKKNSK